jgi:hypothetical protein
MVDRADRLEDDPGVAPLLPPRARLARSPTVALVAAAMLSGAVVWRRSRTSSSPSSLDSEGVRGIHGLGPKRLPGASLAGRGSS